MLVFLYFIIFHFNLILRRVLCLATWLYCFFSFSVFGVEKAWWWIFDPKWPSIVWGEKIWKRRSRRGRKPHDLRVNYSKEHDLRQYGQQRINSLVRHKKPRRVCKFYTFCSPYFWFQNNSCFWKCFRLSRLFVYLMVGAFWRIEGESGWQKTNVVQRERFRENSDRRIEGARILFETPFSRSAGATNFVKMIIIEAAEGCIFGFLTGFSAFTEESSLRSMLPDLLCR